MIVLVHVRHVATRLSADAALAELIHLGAVFQQETVAVEIVFVEGVEVAAGRRRATVLKSWFPRTQNDLRNVKERLT